METDDITGELVEKLLNDLTIMRYDIEAQVGPGPASKRTETAQILSQLAQGNPALQAIVTPSIMRSLDFEESDLVAELAEATLSPEMREIIKKKRNKGKPDAQDDSGQAMQQAVEAIRQEAAQQLQLVDQQLAQVTAQLEQEKMKAQDKSRELDIKERELALKEQESQDKAMSEVRIAEIEAQAEVDVATIQAQAEIIKNESTPVPPAPEKPTDNQPSVLVVDSQGAVREGIQQGQTAILTAVETLAKIMEKADAPKSTVKHGKIIGPEGREYEMTIRSTEE
jgi:hypothetical protein